MNRNKEKNKFKRLFRQFSRIETKSQKFIIKQQITARRSQNKSVILPNLKILLATNHLKGKCKLSLKLEIHAKKEGELLLKN